MPKYKSGEDAAIGDIVSGEANFGSDAKSDVEPVAGTVVGFADGACDTLLARVVATVCPLPRRNNDLQAMAGAKGTVTDNGDQSESCVSHIEVVAVSAAFLSKVAAA